MNEPQQGIEYREIPEYPGYYVGSDGSLWSSRYQRYPGYGGGSTGFAGGPWKRKVFNRYKDGRKFYTLHRNGKGKSESCGALLLMAFVGPRPLGHECCHWDGDCQNDELSNLRWDTKQANKADMVRHGTSMRGEGNGRAKITEEDVREIRRLGKPVSRHAKKYGLTGNVIYRILKFDLWKHVV